MFLSHHRLIERDEAALTDFFGRQKDAQVQKYFQPFPLTAKTAHSICSKKLKDRFYFCSYVTKPVAFWMLRGWDEGYEIPSFGMTVEKSWRGRGIGKSCLMAGVNEAKILGAPAIRLTVHPSHPALSLYGPLGFEIKESSPTKLVLVKAL